MIVVSGVDEVPDRDVILENHGDCMFVHVRVFIVYGDSA